MSDIPRRTYRETVRLARTHLGFSILGSHLVCAPLWVLGRVLTFCVMVCTKFRARY